MRPGAHTRAPRGLLAAAARQDELVCQGDSPGIPDAKPSLRAQITWQLRNTRAGRASRASPCGALRRRTTAATTPAAAAAAAEAGPADTANGACTSKATPASALGRPSVQPALCAQRCLVHVTRAAVALQRSLPEAHAHVLAARQAHAALHAACSHMRCEHEADRARKRGAAGWPAGLFERLAAGIAGRNGDAASNVDIQIARVSVPGHSKHAAEADEQAVALLRSCWLQQQQQQQQPPRDGRHACSSAAEAPGASAPEGLQAAQAQAQPAGWLLALHALRPWQDPLALDCVMRLRAAWGWQRQRAAAAAAAAHGRAGASAGGDESGAGGTEQQQGIAPAQAGVPAGIVAGTTHGHAGGASVWLPMHNLGHMLGPWVSGEVAAAAADDDSGGGEVEEVPLLGMGMGLRRQGRQQLDDWRCWRRRVPSWEAEASLQLLRLAHDAGVELVALAAAEADGGACGAGDDALAACQLGTFAVIAWVGLGDTRYASLRGACPEALLSALVQAWREAIKHLREDLPSRLPKLSRQLPVEPHTQVYQALRRNYVSAATLAAMMQDPLEPPCSPCRLAAAAPAPADPAAAAAATAAHGRGVLDGTGAAASPLAPPPAPCARRRQEQEQEQERQRFAAMCEDSIVDAAYLGLHLGLRLSDAHMLMRTKLSACARTLDEAAFGAVLRERHRELVAADAAAQRGAEEASAAEAEAEAACDAAALQGGASPAARPVAVRRAAAAAAAGRSSCSGCSLPAPLVTLELAVARYGLSWLVERREMWREWLQNRLHRAGVAAARGGPAARCGCAAALWGFAHHSENWQTVEGYSTQSLLRAVRRTAYLATSPVTEENRLWVLLLGAEAGATWLLRGLLAARQAAGRSGYLALYPAALPLPEAMAQGGAASPELWWEGAPGEAAAYEQLPGQSSRVVLQLLQPVQVKSPTLTPTPIAELHNASGFASAAVLVARACLDHKPVALKVTSSEGLAAALLVTAKVRTVLAGQGLTAAVMVDVDRHAGAWPGAEALRDAARPYTVPRQGHPGAAFEADYTRQDGFPGLSDEQLAQALGAAPEEAPARSAGGAAAQQGGGSQPHVAALLRGAGSWPQPLLMHVVPHVLQR